MRTIVHLSDLHFGRVDYAILGPIIDCVQALKPDLVVVSGDLTQRARGAEFRSARAFLDQLPRPQLVVTGNHDIPFYDVVSRFGAALRRYKEYITPELSPWFRDDEIAVAGVSTARSLTFKGGRINAEQVGWLRGKFEGLPEGVVKVIVTHHPFEIPHGHDEDDLLGRADMAIRELADCDVDLFLSGHLHLGFTGNTAHRYRVAGQSSVILQAGTATSTRGRGEVNSFNVIRVEHPSMVIERMDWHADEARFAPATSEPFLKVNGVWERPGIPMPA